MESKSDTVKSYQSDSKTDVNYNILPSSSSSNDDSTSGKTIRRKLLKPCHITRKFHFYLLCLVLQINVNCELVEKSVLRHFSRFFARRLVITSYN